LFGPSKTIRGILISVLITTASAPLIGLDLTIGAIVAGAAMAGDLFSSFVKRRLNFPPSSRALGLDQVPDSLLPMQACGDAEKAAESQAAGDQGDTTPAQAYAD